MRKIFTLIIACVAAITAMAQVSGSFNFVGGSEFYLPVMQEQSMTKIAKDKVVLTFNEDGTQSFTIPAMYYAAMHMTIPSFTIHNVEHKDYTDAYEWGETSFTTTTVDASGATKTVTGTELGAKYIMEKGKFQINVTFKYGTMPMAITYDFTGYRIEENAWGLAGRGTVDNPYRLFDAADFTAMAKNYSTENNGEGKYFLVMNDINFGGSAENPVQLPAIAKDGNAQIAKISGGFKGTFDGGNHTISGIYHTKNLRDAEGQYNGLFGFVDKEGVIKNVIFGKDNYVNSYNYVGSIVSINQGTIENCVNYADITATNFAAGGICGYMVNGNGTVKDCQNYGNIKAMTYAAGICGGTQSGGSVTEYNYLIENCTNNGDLSTTNGTGSAGIAGSYSGSIKGCTNNGNADDTAKSGNSTAGIVSVMSYAAAVEDCVNNGNIKGNKNVGGIIGNVMKGDSKAFTVKNCINNGTITGKGTNVAGIIANSGRNKDVVSVAGCTNNGVVTSGKDVTLLGNIRGSETIAIGEGNARDITLEVLPLDTDNIATGIEDVVANDNTTVLSGKYIKNGKIVIVKNGKAYNVAGIEE